MRVDACEFVGGEGNVQTKHHVHRQRQPQHARPVAELDHEQQHHRRGQRQQVARRAGEERHARESEVEQAPCGQHRLFARLPQPNQRVDAERDEDHQQRTLPPRIIRHQKPRQKAGREAPQAAPGKRNQGDQHAQVSEQRQRAGGFHSDARQVRIAGVAGQHDERQAAGQRPLQRLPSAQREIRRGQRAPCGERRPFALH